MGQILPGVVVAFENPQGGVGKSTLTALFAGYIHSQSNEEGCLLYTSFSSTNSIFIHVKTAYNTFIRTYLKHKYTKISR